ncbi:MAG: response regulator [Desulfovibrio sp.]|jgi:CheY-like chemotaxis protein/PAS domain-containing protein|nr:response regulator [Desulfovibrio sp.]
MNGKHTTETPSTSLPLGMLFGIPALAGCVLGFAVFWMLSWSAADELVNAARKDSLKSLSTVKADMLLLTDRLSALSDYVAQNANVEDDKLAALLEQCKALWPEAGFTFYDRNGEIVTLAIPALYGDSPPLSYSTRYLLHHALSGNAATDITFTRGFLSLSAVSPAPPGRIRAVMATLPIDSHVLSSIKKNSQADLAILPYDLAEERVLTGNASSTFMNSMASSDRWREILNILPKVGGETQTVALDSQALQISFDPVRDSFGTAVGLLVVAPLRDVTSASAVNRLLGAGVSGCCAALLMILAMHLYGGRLIFRFAVDINHITSENVTENRYAAYKGKWPSVLETALRKTALTLKNYRNQAKTANMEKDEAERQLAEFITDVRSRKPRAQEDYLRIFDNSPVGIFQTDMSGYFIRANNAFSIMLNYESPQQLLADNENFANLSINQDGYRNPLSSILENGGQGVIALRKKDGGIGTYELSCMSLTSSADDSAGILECYVQDCAADEQMQKAMRDNSTLQQEHASLSLLLASTTRRLQAYLLPPELADELDELDLETEPDSSDQTKIHRELHRPYSRLLERRKSILPIKELLNDMYQIAMNEAADNPRIDVPLNFERFLQRLCANAAPRLSAKGISMQCKAGNELLTRLNSPAPMLRQALQKALLLVSAQVRKGYIILSVTRERADANDPTLFHAFFDISWTPSLPSHWVADNDAEAHDGLRLLFGTMSDPEALEDATLFETDSLDIPDELDIVRYLVGKMEGIIHGWLFNNDLRSMQISVPFQRMDRDSLFAAGDYGLYMPEALSALHEMKQHGMDNFYSDVGTPVLAAGMDGTSLDLSDLNALSIAPGFTADLEDTAAVPGETGDETGLDILLVDDNLNNRMLFSLFLNATRHRITETCNGQEGVEAFQNAAYDVIFINMEMPMMDGYQATRIIRAMEADKGILQTPIVGMAAHALPEFRRQCMLSGCSDFLYKPFSKSALTSMLDAFIQFKIDTHRHET